MYEFDEELWDRQQEENVADPWRGTSDGWLIKRVVASRLADEDRYLQIGTGQWCAAPFATLFPIRSAAIVYAQAYGYCVGESVEIVTHAG